MPLWQLVNATLLLESIIFAALLMVFSPTRLAERTTLACCLLIIATIKGDEIFQMVGGLSSYPEWGFVLAPAQALMTPMLYLFVRARTDRQFTLRLADSVHALPCLVFTAYLSIFYYQLPNAERVLMVSEGGFDAPLHRLVVPLLGDLVQLFYVGLALRCVRRHGLVLRQWFSRVEGRELIGLKRVLELWGAVFLTHFLWTIAGGVLGWRALSGQLIIALDVVHLVLAHALFLLGLLATDVAAPVALPLPRPGRRVSEAAKALYAQLQRISIEEPFYLEPDLSVADLAQRVGVTPRALSEAINSAGNKSFHVFVNELRVEHAKALLRSSSARVLDVAYESGFNSKTAFNEAFRKFAGTTPSTFRRRARETEPLTSS